MESNDLEENQNSEINDALIQELYPNGPENSYIRQENTGDCYFLATLISLKRKGDSYKQWLSKVIRKNGSNWEVRFPGRPNDVIVITQNDLNGQAVARYGFVENRLPITGDLGDIILERAFGRQKSNDNGRIKETFLELEGNKSSDVIDVMFANRLPRKVYRNQGLPLTSLQQDQAIREEIEHHTENEKDYILYASTIRYPSIPGFSGSHAYCIASYDKANEVISLINPHDTRLSFQVNFEDFLKNFRSLEITQFTNIDQPEEPAKEDLKQEPQPRRSEKYDNKELQKDEKESIQLQDDEILHLRIGECFAAKCHISEDIPETMKVNTPIGIYQLERGDEITLGRALDNFHNNDLTVSRTHATIKYEGEGKVSITNLTGRQGMTAVSVIKSGVKTFPFPEEKNELAIQTSKSDHANQLLSDIWYQYDKPPTILMLMAKRQNPNDVVTQSLPINFTAGETLSIQFSDQERSRHTKTLRVGEKIKIGKNLPELASLDFLDDDHVEIYYGPNHSVYIRSLVPSGIFAIA